MKDFTNFIPVIFLSNAVAFNQPQINFLGAVRSISTNLGSTSTSEEISRNERRRFLGVGASALALVGFPSCNYAGLLDDFGSDPGKIVEKQKVAIVVPTGKKVESLIEPNLRANYYYPTNKKRYLPRIKKCNDAIPDAAENIGLEKWDLVDEFVSKVADDTILPLKLYTSSLTGQGTNVKLSYTKDMMKSADSFEKFQKTLTKTTKKKDREASSKALEGMAEALQTYRTVAGLTGPDGGGNIPSVDEIRRSACRVQGNMFTDRVAKKYAN